MQPSCHSPDVGGGPAGWRNLLWKHFLAIAALLFWVRETKTNHVVGLNMISILHNQQWNFIYQATALPSKGKNSRHWISRHCKRFFPSHLSKIPVNFWDVWVVFKQAGCLDERFGLLAFIPFVSQLLLRKTFLWWASLLPPVSLRGNGTLPEGVYG